MIKKRRVTIGYIDDNNQSVEMKVPLDGFEINKVTSNIPQDAEMIVLFLARIQGGALFLTED